MLKVVESFLKKKILLIWLSILVLAIIFAHGNFSLTGKKISGVLLCICFLIAYYGGLIYAVGLCKIEKHLSDISFKEKFKMSLVTFFSMWFVLREVSLNQFLYCWDSTIVWYPAVNYSKWIFQQPLRVMADLYSSINNTDYNSFLAILFTLPTKLIGGSFVLHVLIGWAMFLVPAAVIMSIAVNILFDKIGWKKLPYTLTYIVLLIIPAIYIPMFLGYVYVSALLPGAILFLLFLQLDFNKLEYKKLTAIGLISIIVVFQNRTLAYMIIGYFAALFVYNVLEIITKKKDFINSIKKIVVGYIYIGVLDIAILIVFFHNFFMRSVFNNFKIAYAAYSYNMNIGEKLLYVLDYFGIIIVLLTVIGIIVGLAKKQLRNYTIALLVWIAVSTMMIELILRMNYHHMYVILIPLWIFILYIPYYIYTFVDRNKYKKTCIYIFLFLLAINFIYAFSGTSNIHRHWGHVNEPLVRYDIDEVKLLVRDLRDITAINKDKIYVLASSNTLNDDIMLKADLPQKIRSLPTLQTSAHVDLRDGFNTAFLDSNIVVVTDPVQIHLSANNQKVIIGLSNLLLYKSPIRDNYKLIKEYTLSPQGYISDQELGKSTINLKGIVHVKVYKKIKPLDKIQINYIEDQFNKAYPEYPDLFKNRFEKYKKDKFNKIAQ